MPPAAGLAPGSNGSPLGPSPTPPLAPPRPLAPTASAASPFPPLGFSATLPVPGLTRHTPAYALQALLAASFLRGPPDPAAPTPRKPREAGVLPPGPAATLLPCLLSNQSMKTLEGGIPSPCSPFHRCQVPRPLPVLPCGHCWCLWLHHGQSLYYLFSQSSGSPCRSIPCDSEDTYSCWLLSLSHPSAK